VNLKNSFGNRIYFTVLWLLSSELLHGWILEAKAIPKNELEHSLGAPIRYSIVILGIGNVKKHLESQVGHFIWSLPL